MRAIGILAAAAWLGCADVPSVRFDGDAGSAGGHEATGGGEDAPLASRRPFSAFISPGGATGGGGSSSSSEAAAGGIAGNGGEGGHGAAPSCLAASDCPGVDAECMARACSLGACEVIYAPFGVALAEQIRGDCAEVVCNGSGDTASVANVFDAEDDGNDCTKDTCGIMGPKHEPEAEGESCGTGKCDGAGACVECAPWMGLGCHGGKTCVSGVCLDKCADGIKNGWESDIDCGDFECAKCGAGKTCDAWNNCASGKCEGGICAP